MFTSSLHTIFSGTKLYQCKGLQYKNNSFKTLLSYAKVPEDIAWLVLLKKLVECLFKEYYKTIPFDESKEKPSDCCLKLHIYLDNYYDESSRAYNEPAWW